MAAHYAYDAGASESQVAEAANWLYLPNRLLALALAVMGSILTRHLAPTDVAIALSLEGLLYVLVGFLVAALPSFRARAAAGST